jgi:hypothetical protein
MILEQFNSVKPPLQKDSKIIFFVSSLSNKKSTFILLHYLIKNIGQLTLPN